MNKNKIKSLVEITIGVIALTVAFYFFFLPMDLVIGGVTGLSILFQDIIDPAIFILIGNSVCLIIGAIFMGKEFIVKTIYGTLLLPVLTFIFEHCFDMNFILNGVSNDVSKLLISVFAGGILAAIGLGMCFRNNATTGGIDVIQKIVAKKFKIPYSTAVYCTDGAILTLALFMLNLELAFYGLIAIFVIGYFVDKVSTGGRVMKTAYIITKKPEEIKELIYTKLNRGVTFSKVTGGYSSDEYTMVISTLSKVESYRLKELIIEVDEHAFTFIAQTTEVIGDGF
ncbi:MAG: YitT family protein [bacterium]